MAKRKTPKRKPGRPKTRERLIGPAEREQISALYLRHCPVTAIAEKLGVSERTVRHHLETHIVPVWKAEMAAQLHIDLAKTAEIERAGWKRYEETGDPADLTLVKWSIEHRARIHGHSAPTKVNMQQQSEIRVAGMNPAEFNAETLTLILQKMEERRRYQAAINVEGRLN